MSNARAYRPPKQPTVLSPRGQVITLRRPTLLVDTREQQPYTFAPFWHWFDAIIPARLETGDYSIAGYEHRIAVERKSKADLFGSLSPSGHRPAFLKACERLAAYDHTLLIIEATLQDIINGYDHSELHPNSVLGSLQAIAVRWGVHPWFAGSPRLAEAMTAQFLHKSYQLCTLEQMGLPRRFRLDDI